LLKDRKWRTTSRVFLLELGFWFDHPSPYAAACLVLVITSGAADLSISTRGEFKRSWWIMQETPIRNLVGLLVLNRSTRPAFIRE
jgi:hypothetical protein